MSIRLVEWFSVRYTTKSEMVSLLVSTRSDITVIKC